MAISSANAAAAPKVRKVETLTSGTSWTVPAGVEFVNAFLVGGGGGGGSTNAIDGTPQLGLGGATVSTTVATTPGASIAYSIGAGGAGGSSGSAGSAGGSTTFTGATTAVGGNGGRGSAGGAGNVGTTSRANNGGGAAGLNGAGGAGGSGWIELEYWV